ncbi:MAG: hypothetical protein JWQ93_1935 [Marmoricola sp.]|jgi:hypothetical protein|nr:hypothetical protein [Marmoricola sp.]MCW2836248.1 hypothetical protein [Marmoricola sp.]
MDEVRMVAAVRGPACIHTRAKGGSERFGVEEIHCRAADLPGTDPVVHF